MIKQLFEQDPNARNIAEFAIGTNPNARLIGNLAEDKKLMGTVHFAIGDNKSLGGGVEASIHLDGLMLKPTVTADNQNRLVECSGKRRCNSRYKTARRVYTELSRQQR